MDRQKLGVFCLDLALGRRQALTARGRVICSRWRLVATRGAKQRVLRSVDLISLGQDLLDLPTDRAVGPVG
jgi:hypothetical protein